MAERVVPVREDYPNNSERAKNKVRREQEERQDIPKKPQRVTKGKVIQKKKSFARRFAEAFGAQEGQGVIDYILYDIIIPATKNMIVDSIINGAEMAILGEVRGRYRRPGDSGRSRYHYDQVSYRESDRYGRDRNEDRDRYERKERPGLHDYEDIVFRYEEDAKNVIDGLVDIIDAYGEATVENLYDLAGITPEYTVGNFGWTNLSRATTRRIRDGYVLDLPRAIVL